MGGNTRRYRSNQHDKLGYPSEVARYKLGKALMGGDGAPRSTHSLATHHSLAIADVTLTIICIDLLFVLKIILRGPTLRHPSLVPQ